MTRTRWLAAAIAGANATVNHGMYACSVGVCPDGTSTFSGLVITYTEPS